MRGPIPRASRRLWLPAPTRCRVERLDAVPGGAFVTSMSDGGVEFVPHLDACFLAVEAGERIVFTNAVDGRWRPAAPEPVAMTAEITLRDHPDGTGPRPPDEDRPATWSPTTILTGEVRQPRSTSGAFGAQFWSRAARLSLALSATDSARLRPRSRQSTR